MILGPHIWERMLGWSMAQHPLEKVSLGLNPKYFEWLPLRYNIILKKKGTNTVAVGNMDESNCSNTFDGIQDRVHQL